LTTITATIIADSLSPAGKRLTTMQLRYPRFIHAEVMTHRQFSRNASSSRAIPVQRVIDDVMSDPAIPLHWGKNQPGMKAREEHDGLVWLRQNNGAGAYQPKDAWLLARDEAITIAHAFTSAGYHKQIVNRLLEPFAHINVLVTATEWENFFTLRDHEDAEPHIALLARAMKRAMTNSDPSYKGIGHWHLSYIDWADEDRSFGNPHELRMVSAARCARISYDRNTAGWAKDLALAMQLLKDGHLSPFEHQAAAHEWKDLCSGNLRGWIQFRQELCK
jgi:thymidylate synthase ThyX